MADELSPNSSALSNPGDWVDVREGEEFPESRQFVRALNRPLRAPKGIPPEQFVALSYRHGIPLMGRAWRHVNRIQASFADNDKEFTGRSMGKIQLLEYAPPAATGFTYDWKPFGIVAKYGDKEWHPVHISFITPCVLVFDRGNQEILGSANLREETAQATTADNRVIKFSGNEIQNFPILCRKSFTDTIEI